MRSYRIIFFFHLKDNKKIPSSPLTIPTCQPHLDDGELFLKCAQLLVQRSEETVQPFQVPQHSVPGDHQTQGAHTFGRVGSALKKT